MISGFSLLTPLDLLHQGKGRVTKHVKRDKFGDIIESETVYKWAAERKK